MALTLQQLYNLRFSGAAKERVAAAIAIGAQTILLELGTVPNHALRQTWAREALLDVNAMAERFQWAVIADATVQAAYPNVPDVAIQNAVNAFVDPYSS